MSMEMLVTAGIETLLNQLLNADVNAKQKIQSLSGKILLVNISELDKPLYFIFSQQVDILTRYEATPDCSMELKVAALPRLSDSSQFTALIKEGLLDIHGDPMIASKFSMLLKELDIDWEEHLSRYTGDVAAHKLMSGAKTGQNWLVSNLAIARLNLAEYLIEEIRLAPGALEIVDFCDEVAELEADCQRLQIRLERLANRDGT